MMPRPRPRPLPALTKSTLIRSNVVIISGILRPPVCRRACSPNIAIALPNPLPFRAL